MMTILYVLLPLALAFAGLAVAAFAWTVRSGQLDDIDTPPRRILFEDERATVAGAGRGPAEPLAARARPAQPGSPDADAAASSSSSVRISSSTLTGLVK